MRAANLHEIHGDGSKLGLPSLKLCPSSHTCLLEHGRLRGKELSLVRGCPDRCGRHYDPFSVHQEETQLSRLMHNYF